MSEKIINRAYLETLSFSDLSHLADKYGIDVPIDLDRHFLIAELLEISEEFDNADDDMIVTSEQTSDGENDLPKNYNETQISALLRNPAWLFVYWNISESDSLMLKEIPGCTLKLRICSLEDPNDSKPEEAFEVQASTESQEQYVLIPTGKKFIKVEIVYVTPSSGKVLAFSPVVTIPQGSKLVNNLQLGRDSDFPEIIELSGMKKILRDHYKNYRHSFS